MGKATRLKAERAAGTRRQPEQDAPRPGARRGATEPHAKGPRQIRRQRHITQEYAFHRSGTPKPSRPSAEPWLDRRSKRARLRNGVSRGAPTNMTRRNDNRTWIAEDARTGLNMKGSRRAAFRARWVPGAVFRTISGKRWVDEDLVTERSGG